MLRTALLLILTLSLGGGCHQRSTADRNRAPGEEGTLRLTDGLGRDVTLPGPARRIVSLAPSCTEILFAIGAGEQVVGVTSFADYPPEAREREQVGGLTRETISVEKIVGLQPDLVCVAGTLQQDLLKDLEQLGLRIFAFEPETVDDILADIRTAGVLTGRAKEAEQLRAELDADLKAIADQVAEIPESERPTVFYEVWDRPLRSASSASYLGQLIERAGGTNIFAAMKQPYPLVNEESVVQASPEVILAPAHGDVDSERFRSRPAWQNIEAVVKGRIVFLDENLVSRPGPRVAQAIQLIASALHPSRFVSPAAPATEERAE